LHEGETGYGSLNVHLQNSCPQTDTITFHYKMLAYQYNEDAQANCPQPPR
jgi:hypothetical protein